MILLLVITVVNWPDIAMIAMGNTLCIIAYISLIGILDREIKRIRAGASAYPTAMAASENASRPNNKMNERSSGNPDALPIEEPVPDSLPSEPAS